MKKISEFEHIKRFSGKFLENLPANLVGIGDDCAVIPYSDNESLVFSTDTLVDTVHFLSDRMPLDDVAYKSLVVNLSDIAAMGGKPLYVLLAIAVPRNMGSDHLDSFFAGFYRGCKEFGVHLIGGDTTKTSDKLVITLTAIGAVSTKEIKYRSNAGIGDYVCVTGNIGDSVGGLYCYLHEEKIAHLVNASKTSQEEKISLKESIELLKKAHLLPRPHIEEGLWLASQSGVKAMIDISDGIESDIQRIMESSGCGAEIELSSLPVSEIFLDTGLKLDWNSHEMAVTGGEDYCLMITVDRSCYQFTAEAFCRKFNRPLTNIGMITGKEKGLIFKLKGEEVHLKEHGYDHFR